MRTTLSMLLAATAVSAMTYPAMAQQPEIQPNCFGREDMLTVQERKACNWYWGDRDNMSSGRSSTSESPAAGDTGGETGGGETGGGDPGGDPGGGDVL